jgi:hypothetical protein
MRMHGKQLLILATLLGLLLVVPSALAGGWAVVTLDELPAEVRQGTSLRLGFMVRQHGQTATNQVKPYLEARNTETGEVFRAEGRQEGPVGHFVVEVTFPSAGSWEWAIVPAPFEGTALPALQVLPAAVQPAGPETAPVNIPQPDSGRSVLRWAGLALLLSAAGIGAITRRGGRTAAQERA